MRNKIEIGKRFGKLVVLGKDEVANKNDKHHKYYLCMCDCEANKRHPKYVSIRSDKLSYGHTNSCGCLKGQNHPSKRGITPRFTNTFNTYSDRVVGITSNNESYIFDKDDFKDIINTCTSWCIDDCGYIMTTRNGKTVRLKDLIMDRKPGEEVRFKDQSKRNDYRKANLVKISKKAS